MRTLLEESVDGTEEEYRDIKDKLKKNEYSTLEVYRRPPWGHRIVYSIENINFPDVEFETPKTSEQPPIDDGLHEKLISLAEKGKINYTQKYIQKASRDILEKIKIRYDRKNTEKSSKMASDLIVSKLSDLLEKTGLIESSPELKQELDENELFKEELYEMVNDQLMPLIPHIGLVSGGVTVAEKIIIKRMKKQIGMNGPPDVDLDS